MLRAVCCFFVGFGIAYSAIPMAIYGWPEGCALAALGIGSCMMFISFFIYLEA